MLEIKKKSPIPIYGVAGVWVLYCLIFPLYRTWHFVVLACVAVAAYAALSALFPGKVEYVEIPIEPELTGDEKIDKLLAEGREAAGELLRLRNIFPDTPARVKLDELIEVTDKIFKQLVHSPDEYRQVRRFADHYLPTTLKLLKTYENLRAGGGQGEHVTATLERINVSLDPIIESFHKIFDSLFHHKALDIETDIRVLENMLKREGFMGKDF